MYDSVVLARPTVYHISVTITDESKELIYPQPK